MALAVYEDIRTAETDSGAFDVKVELARCQHQHPYFLQRAAMLALQALN